MTALEILGIYCILAFIIIEFNALRTSADIKSMLICTIFSAVTFLLTFGLGFIYLAAIKWILAQFGVVTSNDIVYIVIYIILNLFRLKKSS